MAEVRRFRPGDLDGVITLCVAEGWPSLPEDSARALRVLTAPGPASAARTSRVAPRVRQAMNAVNMVVIPFG